MLVFSFRIVKKFTIRIIAVYAATSVAKDEDIGCPHDELDAATQENSTYTIVFRDFNAMLVKGAQSNLDTLALQDEAIEAKGSLILHILPNST